MKKIIEKKNLICPQIFKKKKKKKKKHPTKPTSAPLPVTTSFGSSPVGQAGPARQTNRPATSAPISAGGEQNANACLSCQFHALHCKHPERRTRLSFPSKEHIYQTQSVNLGLRELQTQPEASAEPRVPYVRGAVDCGLRRESTLSSFWSAHTHRRVTQVCFCWPGPSFTSWIWIVIMTYAVVWWCCIPQ